MNLQHKQNCIWWDVRIIRKIYFTDVFFKDDMWQIKLRDMKSYVYFRRWKKKKKICKRAIESGIEIFEPPTYQDS